MFIHLIATLALGGLAAAFVFAFARTIGWKKPGVAYPIAVALGMLSYSVYDEYSWFSRSSGELPGRLEVVRTYATSLPYQPWTYALPRVYRYDAADLASLRTNPTAPGQRLVLMKRITRNTSTVDVPIIVDCAKDRYAELTTATEFGDDGLPKNADWRSLTDHEALRRTICDVDVPAGNA